MHENQRDELAKILGRGAVAKVDAAANTGNVPGKTEADAHLKSASGLADLDAAEDEMELAVETAQANIQQQADRDMENVARLGKLYLDDKALETIQSGSAGGTR